MKVAAWNLRVSPGGVGVALCALGWMALVALVAARILLGAPRDEGILLAGLAAACASILTGATLLVLNALRTGFGALDSFFAAALARSAQRRDERPSVATPETAPQRGYIGDRPFVARSDGSVMVETLLGPRLFPSLADTQDFVGS